MLVVSGASGQIDGQVLAKLVGGDAPIRVVARDPAKIGLVT